MKPVKKGQIVMIPAAFTGVATRKVTVKDIRKNPDKSKTFLCENLPGEPMLFGWYEDIFDLEGNPL